MKKALIIVQNKNSTTKKFGEEIASFCSTEAYLLNLFRLTALSPRSLKAQITFFSVVGTTAFYLPEQIMIG